MAGVDLNPVFEGFKRKIGKLVFFNMEGETFVRKYSVPSNPNSPKQQSVRNAFTRLSSTWKETGGIMNVSWNAFPHTKKRIRGYSAFIGANVNKQRAGEPLELFKPFGETPLQNLTAAPGTAAGDIRVTFNPINSGKHVTFFLQKKQNGVAVEPIIQKDGGANTASPFMIKALETGKEYFIYGIITDAAYDEATSVSEARTAIATAK